MILLDRAQIVDTLVYYMSSFLDGKSISLTILLISDLRDVPQLLRGFGIG